MNGLDKTGRLRMGGWDGIENAVLSLVKASLAVLLYSSSFGPFLKNNVGRLTMKLKPLTQE